jgi:hypothetical protein
MYHFFESDLWCIDDDLHGETIVAHAVDIYALKKRQIPL